MYIHDAFNNSSNTRAHRQMSPCCCRLGTAVGCALWVAGSMCIYVAPPNPFAIIATVTRRFFVRHPFNDVVSLLLYNASRPSPRAFLVVILREHLWRGRRIRRIAVVGAVQIRISRREQLPRARPLTNFGLGIYVRLQQITPASADIAAEIMRPRNHYYYYRCSCCSCHHVVAVYVLLSPCVYKLNNSRIQTVKWGFKSPR